MSNEKREAACRLSVREGGRERGREHFHVCSLHSHLTATAMYKRRIGLQKPAGKRLYPLSKENLDSNNTSTDAVTPPTATPNVNESTNGLRTFKVLWCKASGRKNKKWEEDALLVLEASQRLAILKSLDGSSEIARGTGMKLAELSNVEPGVTVLSFGGREVQINEEIFSSDNVESENSSMPPIPIKYKRIRRIGKASTLRTLQDDNVASLVMPRPPLDLCISREEVVTDVCVDSRLTKVLRSHQKDGILFIYKCLMGYRTPGYYGAILADEMGLGKTLQTISLVYTLLKQGPWNGMPEIKRCLILAPSSLLGNWKEEFNKWLGPERLKVYVGESSSSKITEYLKYPNEPVVIISYEMFVRCFNEISRLDFQLLIADEGHRLKNSSIKASTLIQSMNGTKKRVILTGTPVQNDLK
uniref:DNA repair and recombination protein RAD54Blike [Oryzias latipes] n=1 Tax=Lepeophtheirus salmonis TaxID=72036 RepID=A0A0K2TQB2_LEPSM